MDQFIIFFVGIAHGGEGDRASLKNHHRVIFRFIISLESWGYDINYKLMKRYEWERFDIFFFFLIKNANILKIENVIPPSYKRYTKGVYL